MLWLKGKQNTFQTAFYNTFVYARKPMRYRRNGTVKYRSLIDKFHLSLFPIKEHPKISNMVLEKLKEVEVLLLQYRTILLPNIFLIKGNFGTSSHIFP